MPFRIGELLIQRGLISEAQLEEALATQRHFGGQLGSNLIELGFITDDQLAECLADQLGIPFASAPAVASVEPDVIERVPKDLAALYRCVPLAFDNGRLKVGMADANSLAHRDELSAKLGVPVDGAVLTEVALNYALERYYSVHRPARELQLSDVVSAYRWLSECTSELFSCPRPEDVVRSIPRHLMAKFRPDSVRLIHAEDVADDGTTSLGRVPVENLTQGARPYHKDGVLWCLIQDLDKPVAYIMIEGLKLGYGELELIQVLLEDAQHALGKAAIQEAKAEDERISQALGRYVSAGVAEQIRTSATKPLYGRSQSISVLFADIRGFTATTEHLDPDSTVKMLNAYFEEMALAVKHNAGTVDKFIGDGIMAFWGALDALDDYAAKAVEAARTMQRAVPRLNRKFKKHGVPGDAEINIGIGICTGDALVGNVGTAEHMQYTAIGDVVNVAARLCSRAQPGEILVDSKSALLAGLAHTEEHRLGTIEVKGSSEPVIVYRLED